MLKLQYLSCCCFCSWFQDESSLCTRLTPGLWPLFYKRLFTQITGNVLPTPDWVLHLMAPCYLERSPCSDLKESPSVSDKPPLLCLLGWELILSNTDTQPHWVPLPLTMKSLQPTTDASSFIAKAPQCDANVQPLTADKLEGEATV